MGQSGVAKISTGARRVTMRQIRKIVFCILAFFLLPLMVFAQLNFDASLGINIGASLGEFRSDLLPVQQNGTENFGLDAATKNISTKDDLSTKDTRIAARNILPISKKQGGKWQQLQSGVMMIYHEAQDEEIARRVAALGNKIYEDIKDVYQYDAKKIYVLIDRHAHISNGSYSPFPPLITFYPSSALIDVKGTSWDYYVLMHEIVHYLHYEYPKGLGGTLSKFIGPVGKFAGVIFTPAWVSEGLATALESEYTNGGRLEHPMFRMPQRANVLLDNEESYLQSTTVFREDELADYARRYSYGAEMMRYIGRTYGYQRSVEIWQRFSKFPINLSRQFKKATGKSFYVLHKEMLHSLALEYEKYRGWSRGMELYDADRKRALYMVLNRTERGVLVYRSGYDVKPYFMFYSKNADAESGESMAVLDDVQSNNIRGEGSDSMLAVKDMEKIFSASVSGSFISSQIARASKDGNYIVYTKNVNNLSHIPDAEGSGYVGNSLSNDIFLYDVERKKNIRVTKNKYLKAPALSPKFHLSAGSSTNEDSADNSNGTVSTGYIYVSEYTNGGNSSRLVRIDLTRKEKVHKSSAYYQGPYEVLYEGDGSVVSNKAVSLDETHIAFVERGAHIGVALQLLNLKTGDMRTLIQRDDRLVLESLKFVDNDTLSLVGDIEEPGVMTEMYRIDLVDNVWTKIAQDKVGFLGATLTKDGSVLYVSHNSYSHSLYVYKAEDLLQERVDFARIDLSNFERNRLPQYLNSERIADFGSYIPPKQASTVYPEKIRRIFPAVPSRLNYALPFLSVANSNWSFGYTTQFTSKNKGALFNASVAAPLNDSPYELAYTGRYQTKLANIAVVELSVLGRSSTEVRTASTETSTTETGVTGKDRGIVERTRTYREQLRFSRTLVRSPRNFTLGMSTGVIFLTKIYEVRAAKNLNSYTFALPLSWHDTTRIFLSSPLAWKLVPAIEYTPPLLSNEAHRTVLSLDSYVQTPIGRPLGLRLSNYSAFSSIYYTAPIVTEKFKRATTIVPLVQDSVLTQETDASKPLQTSFEIDLNVNFGSFRKTAGEYFDLYSAYANIFVEQTLEIDTENNFDLQAKDYIIIGHEFGAILGFSFLNFSIGVGAGVQIPYSDEASYGYLSYISVGSLLNGIPGAREFAIR